MIHESEVFRIGKFIKPHGIKGEISFTFDNDVFDRVDCPYLVCSIDGILVPFFVKEHRFKGKETALILFVGIDSEPKAQQFSGLDVYFPRKYYEEEDIENLEYSWEFFIGFTAFDEKKGEIGVIEEVDDKTINVLFLIRNKDTEYIVPANEDFILNIDAKAKTILLGLPDGLLDMI